MNLRNLSAWSIRNPIVPIVLFIGLLLAGLVSFNRMDVNNSPDIDFPGVNVNISQPGAAPTEIETQITQKVEAAVRSINGVDEIQSTASEGNSSTFVQFVIGTDANDAVNEVKNAVDQIRGDLPDGILEPRVSKVEVGGSGPIGYFAVRADDMTMEQLSWFVDDTVSRRLMSIDGMAAVSRAGGVDREIRVVLDPARMQSLGVTASQVNTALRAVNIDAAGGRAEIAGSRQSVRVLGNADDAFRLGETRINLSGGRTIKLTDIAQVYDGYSEQTSIAKIRGKQVVTFSLERAKGASDVTVYDAAMKEIEALAGRQSRHPHHPALHLGRLHQGPVHHLDGSHGRGRDPGGDRGVLVPARLARDDDQRGGDPARGDPDLLVHGPARLHAQRALAARAEPRRRRAGRRRDRRDREHRAPHAHGQERLPGVDRRRRRDRPRGGRDHLLDRRGVPARRPDARHLGPVLQELRPDRGRRGADVAARRAHDHPDDRGLFPQGQGPSGARRGPDDGSCTCSVLAWSLDTRVAHEIRARLVRVPLHASSFLVETVFVVAVAAALVMGGWGAAKADRAARAVDDRGHPDNARRRVRRRVARRVRCSPR